VKRACLILFALTAACGPKVKSHATLKLDPLPAGVDVAVFADSLPVCQYEQVGLIGSEDLESTLNRAREMGADGVIGTILAANPGAGPDPVQCGTPRCPQFNTVAIRFANPDCRH
jgi:hypothetical protein